MKICYGTLCGIIASFGFLGADASTTPARHDADADVAAAIAHAAAVLRDTFDGTLIAVLDLEPRFRGFVTHFHRSAGAGSA